jgi:hypothetical protein
LGLGSLKIRLVFKGYSGTDSIQMNGKLKAAGGLSLNGQMFAVDIGGVMRNFTLDGRGIARTPNDRVTYKKRSGKFTISLSRGNFAPILASSGLTNEDLTRVPRTVNVSMIFNQVVYQTAKSVIYNSTEGKFGVAR